MLTTLRIENLAIIDHLEIEFGSGLNVLTGETGAGKSIIAGALGLVLGSRAAGEAVRHGAEEGRVEALFDIGRRPDVAAALARAGLPEGDGELLVRRLVSRTGRSKVYVNGALATVQSLVAATGPLVDVSSQHEQYSLLNAATHLDILDEFAGVVERRRAFGAGFRELLGLRTEVARLVREAADRVAREDFLRFQLEELERAALRPGEDEELRQERVRLRNAEGLREATSGAEELLYEGRTAVTALLERARALAAKLADLDPRAAPLAGRLEAARIEIEDVAFELRAYREGIDSDPGRLQAVEDRLDLIRTLGRKHGGTADQILARERDLRTELTSLASVGERRDELEAAIAAREAALLTEARAISEVRREAAGRLEAIVHASLASLAMGRCRLRVAFEDGAAGAEALHETGLDRLEFCVATNVGEGYKSLARVASGGELSRILLALKRALTHAGSVATFVFDEVDTGIGGAVAETVGRLLAETAARHQVLCITHLPQVACYADRHFRVEKQEEDGRTVTRVGALDGDEQVEEVARMVGGLTLTDKTRAAAAEMIRTAAVAKGR